MHYVEFLLIFDSCTDMNTNCYDDFTTELLTVVLRSLKLCDCRWRFRSGCM